MYVSGWIVFWRVHIDVWYSSNGLEDTRGFEVYIIPLSKSTDLGYCIWLADYAQRA